jgi:hypothetical protein
MDNVCIMKRNKNVELKKTKIVQTSVSINKIVAKNYIYNSIFDSCWIYPFCNTAGGLNEGGQT